MTTLDSGMGPPEIGAFVRSDRIWQNVSCVPKRGQFHREERPARQFLKELDHLGNGPALMGPESTGSQACLQWAHWTLRAAASLAPERVSSAMEFFFWQWGQVRSTKTWSGADSVSASAGCSGAWRWTSAGGCVFLLARFLSYRTSSARASISSGRSPSSYCFHPAEKVMGMCWPCQSTSREPRRP